MKVIYDVAPGTFSKVLERNETYTLVFDGLDESRFYCMQKV
jgi:hypothetical protein